MVEFEQLENEDLETLKFYIERHYNYTNSNVAKNILENWEETIHCFVKVMPSDYKNVLMSKKADAESINA